MKSLPYIGWTPKRSVIAELKPVAGAEAWSELVAFGGKPVAPATVFFRNAIGGRVAVISRSLDSKPHASIYSPRKQEMFHRLFDRLAGDSPLDVTAPKTPSTWLVAAKNDHELLVMAENLCGEPRPDVILKFAPAWHGGAISVLQQNGEWRMLGSVEDSFRVPEDMILPLAPQFFRVVK